MKKIKIISFVLTLAFVCAAFTACGPFEGFDDDDAIVSGNSFSSVGSMSKQTLAEYTFRANKCNGVKRIKDITVPADPVFEITLTVESGRFKVVLVKDGEVWTIADGDDLLAPLPVPPAGTYNLRIVAKDAKVNLRILFDVGTLIS
ncbi:MAG: copper resistance protein CopC [Firmicutes bacterium]|nr:copper resistance protein CopC [Bacillota bacterium]